MVLKEAGHPQYFAAAVAGVFLLLLGSSIHAWASASLAWYPELGGKLLSILPQGEEKSGAMDRATLVRFAACATWALVLAWILAWLLNLPLLTNARLLRAAMKRAGTFDAIEHISSHSLDCGGLPLAITLKNKKVYVGTPLALSPLDIERKWLVLVPLLSGYRTDTLKLELPVNYGEVYKAIFRDTPENAARLINEFRVVVAFTEIVSIQTFNIDTYYEHFKKTHPIDQSDADEDGTAPEMARTVHAAWAETNLEAAIERVQTSWAAGIESLAQRTHSGLSQEEATGLNSYYGYLVLLVCAIVVLPYSLPGTVVLLFASGLFAIASSFPQGTHGLDA